MDDGILETIGSIREFVYKKYEGWTLGDNYATSSLGILGREHIRLWTIYTGAVVAAAHEDSPIPHKAVSFEGEENRIRGIFTKPLNLKSNLYNYSGWLSSSSLESFSLILSLTSFIIIPCNFKSLFTKITDATKIPRR